jgi:taurine dioxygenase
LDIEVRSLSEQLGVLIEGIDFAKPVSGADRERLIALWNEHGLLLIRGSNVSPESQIAFSRIFGELEEHPLKTIRAGQYPELMELNSEDAKTNPVAYWDGEAIIGRLPWHKDLIYTAKPNHGAILRAVIIPPTAGETGYGDQQRAYDALSDATKARISDLEVVYRFGVSLRDMRFIDTSGYVPGPGVPKNTKDLGFPDFPDSVHPLVLEHPVTGRRSLNISPMFLERVDGMPPEQSDALLRELVAHATSPEFCYLHRWTPGEVILWDNWRFMHSAPGIKPGDRRIIHRTTILGDASFGRVAA